MLSEAAEDRAVLRGAADPANRAIDVRNAALRTEIRLARGGLANAEALQRAIRDSVLYVLPLGEEAVMCADLNDITWVLAFTSVDEVALYAAAKGATAADEIDYLSVTGAHLVEQVLPAWGRATGIALDVAGSEPLMLPILPASLDGASTPETVV